jgi:hypothetical protein
MVASDDEEQQATTGYRPKLKRKQQVKGTTKSFANAKSGDQKKKMGFKKMKVR